MTNLLLNLGLESFVIRANMYLLPIRIQNVFVSSDAIKYFQKVLESEIRKLLKF